MSEVEFDLLLEAVETAIAPDFEEEFVAQSLPPRQPLPRAANDNDNERKAWPLIPFPDGWYAAC